TMSTAADTFLMSSVYWFIFFTAACPRVASTTVIAAIRARTTAAYTARTAAPAANPPSTVAPNTAAMNGGATHPKPAAPYPTPYEKSFPWTVRASLGVHVGNSLFRMLLNGFTSQLYWIAVNMTAPITISRPPTSAWSGGTYTAATPAVRMRTPAMRPYTRMIPEDESIPASTALRFVMVPCTFASSVSTTARARGT